MSRHDEAPPTVRGLTLQLHRRGGASLAVAWGDAGGPEAAEAAPVTSLADWLESYARLSG